MTVATILAVLGEGASGEAALATALTLGRHFEARVTALHVAIDPERSIPLLGEGMTGPMIADLTASLQTEAERGRREAEALFKRLCVDARLPVVEPDAAIEAGRFAVCLRIVVGVETEVAAETARLHDLIVIGRGDEAEGYVSPTLEAVLFDSGRPVLVPPTGGLAHLPERMAVAWNGSRESARALGAALPLLAAARQTLVITGEGRDDRAFAHPSALGGYLAAHRVAAETWLYQPDDWPVSASLLAEARKAGAGLLVMGAYGHSRLRELVLGGATRAALKEPGMALLMAH